MVPADPGSGQARGELRGLLELAWPIVGAQLAFVGIGVTDTMLAGRLSASDLAAVAVGANVWMLLLIAASGLCMAASPLVAQRVGAGLVHQTSALVQHALLLGLSVGLLWALGQYLVAPHVVAALALPEDTSTLAVGYLRASAAGGLFLAPAFALRYAAEGRGASRPVLRSALLALLTNALADWVFMYGVGPVPALGAVGCGLASAVAGFVVLLSLGASWRADPALRGASPWRRLAPGLPDAWRELLALGVPIAVIWVAEAGLFAGMGLMAARLGETVAGAHQIAINVAAVAFMVPMGIGLAASARVGMAAGAGNAPLVRRRCAIALRLAVGWAALSAALMALLPEAIVSLYTDVAPVAGMAVSFLHWAALFQVFDALQAVASGCLRGLKDTRVPMRITVLSYWGMGLGLGAACAFATAMGAHGLWLGLVAGLSCAAVGLLLRLRIRLRSL